MNEKIPATVTILTYNSEKVIGRCLASVSAFAEILILDGGSTDRTMEIARSYGARIERQSEVPGPITNYTSVRIRSFERASYDWIFWIDSDEIADQDLITSMRTALRDGDIHRAFRVPAFPVIDGRTIRYAYFMPLSYIRFVNRKTASWSVAKRVHERVDLLPGVHVKRLTGELLMPWATPEEYRLKNKKYITLAFSRAVIQRPSIRRTTASIAKNIVFMCWIITYGIYANIRYSNTRAVMPFAYHWRFAMYHLAIVRERFRQYLYGVHYTPPSSS